jgi:hypothetical protein
MMLAISLPDEFIFFGPVTPPQLIAGDRNGGFVRSFDCPRASASVSCESGREKAGGDVAFLENFSSFYAHS